MNPQAIRTIHAALDAGVRLLDTAINYCMAASEMGRNERLVAKALDTWSGTPMTFSWCAKGKTAGRTTSPTCTTAARRISGGRARPRCGPWASRSVALHAPCPRSPGAAGGVRRRCSADLQAEGKIQMVGVSNLGRRQLATTARTIVDIAAVDNNLAPARRGALPLARVCEAEEIALLAWAPLGGQVGATTLKNSQPAVSAIAAARGTSPHVVALAWCLAQAANVIPIPSARRPETILDSVTAWDLTLTPEEFGIHRRRQPGGRSARRPAGTPLRAHRLGDVVIVELQSPRKTGAGGGGPPARVDPAWGRANWKRTTGFEPATLTLAR